VTGPVQVLVIGFDKPHFSGESLAELARLRDAGIVRLIDLLVVERRGDETLHTLPAPDSLGPEAGALALSVLGASSDDPPDTGAAQGRWSLVDAVPPGSVAVVALIEHLWAEPLVGAVRRAGGQTLEEAWLAPEDLSRLEGSRIRS
jgi:hypothetical protein